MSRGRNIIAPGIGVFRLAPLLEKHIVAAPLIGPDDPGVDRGVKRALPVGNAPFLHSAGAGAVRIPLVKEFQCFPVQRRIAEHIIFIIHKLQ